MVFFKSSTGHPNTQPEVQSDGAVPWKGMPTGTGFAYREGSKGETVKRRGQHEQGLGGRNVVLGFPESLLEFLD